MPSVFAPFSALFLSFRLVSPLRYFSVSLSSYAVVILLRPFYCGHYLLRGLTSIGYCLFLIVFSFQVVSLSSKQSSDPSSVFAWRTSRTTPFNSSWKWLPTNRSRGKTRSSKVPFESFAFSTGKDSECSQPSIARHGDRFGLCFSLRWKRGTHCTRSTGPEGVKA